jgi:hypothetical protein
MTTRKVANWVRAKIGKFSLLPFDTKRDTTASKASCWSSNHNIFGKIYKTFKV